MSNTTQLSELDGEFLVQQRREGKAIFSTKNGQRKPRAANKDSLRILQHDVEDIITEWTSELRREFPKESKFIYPPIRNIYDYFDDHDVHMHGVEFISSLLQSIAEQNKARNEKVKYYANHWFGEHHREFHLLDLDSGIEIFSADERSNHEPDFLEDVRTGLKIIKGGLGITADLPSCRPQLSIKTSNLSSNPMPNQSENKPSDYRALVSASRTSSLSVSPANPSLYLMMDEHYKQRRNSAIMPVVAKPPLSDFSRPYQSEPEADTRYTLKDGTFHTHMQGPRSYTSHPPAPTEPWNQYLAQDPLCVAAQRYGEWNRPLEPSSTYVQAQQFVVSSPSQRNEDDGWFGGDYRAAESRWPGLQRQLYDYTGLQSRSLRQFPHPASTNITLRHTSDGGQRTHSSDHHHTRDGYELVPTLGITDQSHLTMGGFSDVHSHTPFIPTYLRYPHSETQITQDPRVSDRYVPSKQASQSTKSRKIPAFPRVYETLSGISVPKTRKNSRNHIQSSFEQFHGSSNQLQNSMETASIQTSHAHGVSQEQVISRQNPRKSFSDDARIAQPRQITRNSSTFNSDAQSYSDPTSAVGRDKQSHLRLVDPLKVFVQGMSNEHDIAQLFKVYGNIREIRIPPTQSTAARRDRTRSIAFVKYSTSTEVNLAIQHLDGHLDGNLNPLKVAPAFMQSYDLPKTQAPTPAKNSSAMMIERSEGQHTSLVGKQHHRRNQSNAEMVFSYCENPSATLTTSQGGDKDTKRWVAERIALKDKNNDHRPPKSQDPQSTKSPKTPNNKNKKSTKPRSSAIRYEHYSNNASELAIKHSTAQLERSPSRMISSKKVEPEKKDIGLPIQNSPIQPHDLSSSEALGKIPESFEKNVTQLVSNGSPSRKTRVQGLPRKQVDVQLQTPLVQGKGHEDMLSKIAVMPTLSEDQWPALRRKALPLTEVSKPQRLSLPNLSVKATNAILETQCDVTGQSKDDMENNITDKPQIRTEEKTKVIVARPFERVRGTSRKTTEFGNPPEISLSVEAKHVPTSTKVLTAEPTIIDKVAPTSASAQNPVIDTLCAKEPPAVIQPSKNAIGGSKPGTRAVSLCAANRKHLTINVPPRPSSPEFTASHPGSHTKSPGSDKHKKHTEESIRSTSVLVSSPPISTHKKKRKGSSPTQKVPGTGVTPVASLTPSNESADAGLGIDSLDEAMMAHQTSRKLAPAPVEVSAVSESHSIALKVCAIASHRPITSVIDGQDCATETLQPDAKIVAESSDTLFQAKLKDLKSYEQLLNPCLGTDRTECEQQTVHDLNCQKLDLTLSPARRLLSLDITHWDNHETHYPIEVPTASTEKEKKTGNPDANVSEIAGKPTEEITGKVIDEALEKTTGKIAETAEKAERGSDIDVETQNRLQVSTRKSIIIELDHLDYSQSVEAEMEREGLEKKGSVNARNLVGRSSAERGADAWLSARYQDDIKFRNVEYHHQANNILPASSSPYSTSSDLLSESKLAGLEDEKGLFYHQKKDYSNSFSARTDRVESDNVLEISEDATTTRTDSSWSSTRSRLHTDGRNRAGELRALADLPMTKGSPDGVSSPSTVTLEPGVLSPLTELVRFTSDFDQGSVVLQKTNLKARAPPFSSYPALFPASSWNTLTELSIPEASNSLLFDDDKTTGDANEVSEHSISGLATQTEDLAAHIDGPRSFSNKSKGPIPPRERSLSESSTTSSGRRYSEVVSSSPARSPTRRGQGQSTASPARSEADFQATSRRTKPSKGKGNTWTIPRGEKPWSEGG